MPNGRSGSLSLTSVPITSARVEQNSSRDNTESSEWRTVLKQILETNTRPPFFCLIGLGYEQINHILEMLWYICGFDPFGQLTFIRVRECALWPICQWYCAGPHVREEHLHVYP